MIKRGHLKRFIYKEPDAREAAPGNKRVEEFPKEERAETVKAPVRVIHTISDRGLKCGGCIHCPTRPYYNKQSMTITFEKTGTYFLLFLHRCYSDKRQHQWN